MPYSTLASSNTLLADNVEMDLPQVIRRQTGSTTDAKPRIVPWLGHKICNAVNAAASSLGLDDSIGKEIRAEIEFRLRREQPVFLHIEQLQDLVEETLIETGHPRVALSYAKYRARRTAIRDHESTPADESDSATDQLELTSNSQLDELQARIDYARLGLDLILSEEELLSRLLKNLGVEMNAVERRDTIILNARGLIDIDSDSRLFAARILLTFIYEETLAWKVTDGIDHLKTAHQNAFLEWIPQGINAGRLDKRLAQFDLNKLAEIIDPFADLQFDFIAIQTLYDRYLINEVAPGHKKSRIEAPQIFWLRVAMGLALIEAKEKNEFAIQFYNLYKSKRACSSTPTLFNAGTVRPQLSSCYLLSCNDSIEDITETWRRFSHLSKWAGGLGCSWSAVRGTGAHISGTNGQSSGIVPFLKVANDIALAVNQGGKRPGALCSYVELWHWDIEEFLELRKETGDDRRRTHNMNTAHWIPDLFMKRLQLIADAKLPKDTTWTLFHSNDVADLPELSGKAFEERYFHYEQQAEAGMIGSRKIRVLALWKKMIESLFETGHPWLTWKDPANIRSPQDHVGKIHNSNLCTEITLNTSQDEVAVCNLASINLAEHLDAEGEIDFNKTRETVQTLMRMLDNVIDINFYPVDAAADANTKHRPVGLGVMGLQDVLYRKGIPFDSPEAVELNDELLEFIAFTAYSASADLAAERGSYATFEGSKWDRNLLPMDTLQLLEEERQIPLQVNRNVRQNWDELREKIRAHGMRNSNCLAIAPTATISNIMGCCPCIEPTYKNVHTKSNLSGEFIHINGHLIRDLQAAGLWDEEMRTDIKYFEGSVQPITRIPENIRQIYKTAFEIEPTWILQAAAVRQKWIDQAQSTNLWLADNNARSASFMYREAWLRGLKTTYYLRTLNKSGIDNARLDDRTKSNPAKACSINAARTGEECEACQ